MPSRILPPGRPHVLATAVSRALLLGSLSLPAVLPAIAMAETASTAAQQYTIAPGSLDSALNRYADQAGILLAIDAQLTSGKTSAGLNGSFSVQEGLARILAGTGLEAVAQTDGNFVLRKVSVQQNSDAAELGAINVTAQASAITEGSGSFTTRSTNTATGLKLTPRETPQSVTVMTRDRMDDQATNDISTVLAQAVGVTVNATSAVGSDGVNFYARGFEIKNFQIDGTPRPTAIYGFSETTTDMALYDRVEIVRGANGLMSGAGSPSAAVNLVRKKPTTETKVSVSAEIGSFNHNRLEVDAGGALNSGGTIRGRVVAVTQDSDSFIDRVNLEKEVLYGIVEFDLTEKTLLTLGLEYQDFTNNGASRGGAPLFFSDGTLTKSYFPRSTNTGAEWNELNHQTTRFFGSVEQFFDNGWSVKLEAENSRPDYDESFGYMYGSFDAATGAGASLLSGRWAGDLEQSIVNLSASGPFDFLGRQHELVLGASYNTAEDKGNVYPIWWSGPAYWAALPNAWAFMSSGYYPKPDMSATGERYGGRIEQTGAYAAVRLKASDTVSVILGSRVSSWKETQWDTTAAGVTTSSTLADDSGVITPYAGLVFDLNANLSAYASYADIFEAQGAEDASGKRLDPLTGSNYEVGLKGEFNEGKLNTTLALFRIEQSNFAVAVPNAPANPNGIFPSTAEDGTVSQGIELEAAGALAPGWQLGGGYAYAKPENADGEQLLTEVPKDSFKLFSTYQLPGELQALTVGGNLRWQGKSFVTAAGPNGEDFVQDALATVDVMAKYAVTKNVSAALNINNFFDKNYYSGFAWGSGNYAAPRNFMLSLKWSL